MSRENGWSPSMIDLYPNRLTIGAGDPAPLRWRLMVVLFLACLLPRAWEAWQRERLSAGPITYSDSVTYYDTALAFGRGDFDQAFGYLGLNAYPAILWGLHSTGLDWPLTAKCWSVLMGALAVLPLFGWVRRILDDRVAIVACLIYAFHGTVVMLSPFVIREPTFWFFLFLSIYLLWRAVVEIRWPFFLLGGMALTLCVHLRSEGWLLVPTLAIWATVRCRAAGGQRRKVLFGLLACLAIIPASVTLVNLTVLRSSPQWSFFRVDQVEIVTRFLTRDNPPIAAFNPKEPVEDMAALQVYHNASLITRLRKVGLQVLKAYTYLGSLLFLIGVATWHKVSFRSDHQAFTVMGVLLLAAAWLRSLHGPIEPRYFMSMVLVSLPWMALGGLTLYHAILERTAHFIAWTTRRRAALTVGLAVALLIPASLERYVSLPKFWDSQAAIGKWIAADYGPGCSIWLNVVEPRLVQYYAQGKSVEHFSATQCDRSEVQDSLTKAPPDLILIWINPKNSRPAFEQAAQKLIDRQDLGYRRVPRAELPPLCDDVIVLSRVGKSPEVAVRSTGTITH